MNTKTKTTGADTKAVELSAEEAAARRSEIALEIVDWRAAESRAGEYADKIKALEDERDGLFVSGGAELRLPDLKKATQMWIGLLPSSPLFSRTIQGLTFQQETHTLVRDKDGQVETDGASGVAKRNYHRGSICMVTPAKLAALRKTLPLTLVNVRPLPDKKNSDGSWESGRIAARLVKVNSRGYKPHPDDRPVSDYMYMVPAADAGKYGDGVYPSTLSG